MWNFRPVLGLLCFVLLCSSAALVAGQRSRPSPWQTLSGDEPLVVARGGFSGLFPDSSMSSYGLALQMSLPNTILLCDVQLTKDEQGICMPGIDLANTTGISKVYPNRSNTSLVNNVPTTGYFAVDFTLAELRSVFLYQRIYTRPFYFDGQPIVTVNELAHNLTAPQPAIWLSIPYDTFFTQRGHSMRTYISTLLRSMTAQYISSPEVGFLRFMSANRRIRNAPKRVFQFLDPNVAEPTTNTTYALLLNNLTFIREFADGILVPKTYIWPVTNLYLQNYSSLVVDAHRAGLEVFASGFANDATLPYNYSYDPMSEYLSFIDNSHFSVDGVVSEFPVTPSATIDCFAHLRRNDPIRANISVISHEGSSMDFPGCTDLAYIKAVSDGANILDCPVQITNDGIPICFGSINLMDRTNAAQSKFFSQATDNPELNILNGIFTYNLTWEDIQTLRPAIYNPYGTQYQMFRNPIARALGKFMRLSDFLAFVSNQTSVSGVLITIQLMGKHQGAHQSVFLALGAMRTHQILPVMWPHQMTDAYASPKNAAYLAANQSLGVTDAVLSALSDAGYNNGTAKRVMISSNESAVLKYIKRSNNYELVYLVDEDVRDILNDTVSDIKGFASSVVLSKKSVFPTDQGFVTGETNIVEKLHAVGLRVYVELFRNEFVAQAYDYFSDAYVELNTFFSGKAIDGVITDNPATADKYKRNRCLGYANTPAYMSPVQPGGLFQVMTAFPPAEAPRPDLSEDEVAESPLPPVSQRLPPPTTNSSISPLPAPPGSGQPTLVASTLGGIAILLTAFMLC